MATPTLSAPNTRWPRPEGSSFATSGRGRGGGGGGRGRNRSGRGRNGGSSNPGGAPRADKDKGPEAPKSAQPPAPTTGPAVSAPTPKPTVNASSVPVSSTSASELKEKPTPRSKGRKASRAPPALVVSELAGPATEPGAATASSPARSPNRRRRSQQAPKGNSNSAGLKVNVPASLDDNLLRPHSNHLAVPHSAPPQSKDMPPHLTGSFDIRNNINALVERVRAVAMENRPSTPGSASHIDWAGDEDDEGLPDLDDWGVKTTPNKQDDMISPIIVDGLRPLPEPVVNAPTPPQAKAGTLSPFALKEEEQQPTAAQAQPLHPSLPPKPVSSTLGNASGSDGSMPANKSSATSTAAPAEAVPPTPAKEKGDGLAASIHASPSTEAPPPFKSTLSPHVPEFNPTHQRAHTIGRNFPNPQAASFNLNSRFSRSGPTTPRGGGFAARNNHARTHSSPPVSQAGNHRTPHSRPIITGDAISRLARTIAAPARTPAIASNT
ncbi:hypothetical protein MKEN_00072200 [Mycena kentingensis (nom. inval.)]|nr:hypothetical protein MKEN_00072200 [Mycena kentingensis (nom. inval.)]